MNLRLNLNLKRSIVKEYNQVCGEGNRNKPNWPSVCILQERVKKIFVQMRS